MSSHRNPAPTVDLIIEMEDSEGRTGIVLIERKNPPFGWALPGGFVEYGETLEEAAVREAKEETSLDVRLVRQFHSYSAPDRDPRGHTITTVFIARATGRPRARDDARAVGIFDRETIPHPLAFDHGKILADYRASTKENLMEHDTKKEPSSDKDAPLRELTSVWGPAEGDVIKAFLESHGITSLSRGRILQSVYPFSMNGLGQIRIFVQEKDFETAKTLLAQLPKPEDAEEFEKDREEDS
jgi:8-oxo-dGTP diphosphatase